MTDDSQFTFIPASVYDRDSRSAVHAFVQAGGHSSRMGTDKAWIELQGRPMIEHVLAAAKPVAASTSIIINAANPNAGRYQKLAEQWNARLLHDLHDHQGPLGGIHTALKHCPAGGSALILACDMPFVTAEFLSLLCAIHQSERPQIVESDQPLITVPFDHEGRLQPLAAVYAQSCLTVVEERLTLSQLKVDRLYDVIPTQRVAFSAFAHLPTAQTLLQNINTQTDHQASINIGQQPLTADTS